MRLIKFAHSCIRVEHGDRAVVIDPGSFSDDAPLDGAEAVLITHEHPDHLDPEKLRARPDLQIWTNAAVKAALGDTAGDRVHVVADGDRATVAGFGIAVHGELHEVIHPDLPTVQNIGFHITSPASGGSLFHPGDAFTVLDRPVDTLVVPISAPWLRARDSIDYVRRVRPRLALAGHDGLYNDVGLSIVDGLMTRLAAGTDSSGVEYRRMVVGTAVDLP